MKLKLLLFLLLFTGILNAQEPYRSLIISESRANAQPDNYIELTNMGDKAINLNEFKFGDMRPWIPQPVLDVWNDPWVPEGNRFFMLPDRVLQPGESWVITTAYDFGPAMYARKVDGFEGNQRPKQLDMYDLADYLVHIKEPKSGEYPWVKDSVTTSARYGDAYQWVFEAWEGRECFYIEHHFAPGDSAVVDQVNGVFDDNGRNYARSYDVAGVTGATGNSNLIRKFTIKTGNLDFANARGVGNEDSEWIPIQRPSGYNSWRDTWWTVGNHGNYVLNENTLESDVIDVDFAGKKLTVPWGVRRLDDIMRHMVRKPGIAWHYELNPIREDSLYLSARTGDKLTVFVVGDELQTAVFDIEVAAPTADAKIVVPKAQVDIASVAKGGPIRTNTQAGIDGLGWPRVTSHAHGNDTITGTWYGVAFSTRTDSLQKYLEKPSNASWDFVWVDGVARPDLKDGDKLKVTAQDGSVKEYYIQVRPYVPSHNAYLSSITWPDIPTFYKGIFGWMGDTVPNFGPTNYQYKVQVPLDVDGIPALIAKTQSLNATVDVKRAVSLAGDVNDRTVAFTVTAEDDSVTNTYSVELVKEKDPKNLQPFHGEPFISELVYWEQWSNSFGEIANPGNQPLDLSNYMIAMQWNTNPASVIESRMQPTESEWLNRYDKYVPGYKWVNLAQWAVTPGILEQDLSVNPVVLPGDVFCLGSIHTTSFIAPSWLPTYVWPVPAQLDVQFNNHSGVKTFNNPWGEAIAGDGNPIRKWQNSHLYLFKILNDSIKLGLKPANDPKDFELIDVFGMAEVTDWVIGGKRAEMITNWMRKPDVYHGNTGFGQAGSFGTNVDDTEWTWTNIPYWQARNAGWPMEILNIGNFLGQHFMNEPTHYKSTVSSVVYKVSDGYSMNEEIRGLTTGTTVSTFIGNLNKANENQVLTIKSGNNELGMNDIISMNDMMVVLSADSTNTSQYRLDVTEDGLSSNAVLTSTLYEIEIVSEPKSATEEGDAGSGSISGFEYGTQLRTILNNITVPAGAHLDVIDAMGAYVSQKKLNFDTAYVNVTVNPDTYFEVTAENGITKIIYQLQPNASDNDAFILSDVYNVRQSQNLVEFVPRGTNVNIFMSNIVPALGASVKLVDKMGHERTEGSLYQDDKVVVTSSNGLVTRVYHLSMLRTQYILSTTYLAYVLSDVYTVDQVEYVIAGPSSSTTINDFYAGITPSMGATAMLVDANGTAKTTGTLARGDMLKVTSADGHIEVMYELNVTVVSAELPSTNQIEIYPNPTNGRLNVRGVEAGNRIQVYNSNGAVVRDMKVRSTVEVLSIDDQPSGMYMIVISNDNTLLGRYKAVKK
jgi:hypothetical protein